MLNIYKTILLPFVLFCLGSALRAQTIERYNSFSYNVNEGLLQSNVWDLAFDKNNFCWISFANGIQKFDGKSFINIPVQSGLPDDKWVNFFRCSNGDLLLSHSEGISKYYITANRFRHVYSNMLPAKGPVIFIGEDENIIYFYTENGKITGLDASTFKVITEIDTRLPVSFLNGTFRPRLSDNIINHKVALLVNSTLYLWDLKEKKLLSQSAPIASIASSFLTLKSAHEVLYYDYKSDMSLQFYDFTTRTTRVVFLNQRPGAQSFRSVIYAWQDKMLLSYYNNMYETDTGLHIIKTTLTNFQNQAITGNASISKIKEDNFGNLYLVTINNGFKKVIRNNYPIKYYGTEIKEGNYTLSILPDKKNNRILAGTYGNGLLIFDTLQRLVKHIKTLPGKNTSFSPNAILKNNQGDYIFFVFGATNAFKLSNDLTKLSDIEISTSPDNGYKATGYFGNLLFQNDAGAMVQVEGSLYKINFSDNSITGYTITNTSTMSGFANKSSIITHTSDELIFLEATTLKQKQKIPFKNTGGVRCFVKDAAQNIYVGSNKGIFKIDSTGKVLFHWDKEKGLPDECIYAMAIDDDDFLWCSTNQGVFRINKDNSILQLKKEDGLQENEFNTNAVAKTADGEIFFGGVNGISSFYPAAINSLNEKIKIFFTGIKINNEEAFKDTALWNIGKIDLPYYQNALSFDFIAMASNNPGQYIYQYRMDGVDKQWIQNNGMQTVRYHLPPGNYVFKVHASRFFDKDADPMKEILIIIHPPLWKRWWFLTGLAMLLAAALFYAVNQFIRAKYKSKLAALEGEQRIRVERERISRDLHDSIGAYANAVLYNTERLEKEKEIKLRDELMKDLKFASKDIITSLRETIWALKKDNYTADDCLMRIRNFIQPFTRYYQLIQFKIEGQAPANREMHYTRALNLVRIVQEAVTNSIKHAGAANIRIISSTEAGQWQLKIMDDGKGFDDTANKQAKQGNGLNNMKHRAADASFDISIQSQQGIGTSIILTI